MPLRHRSKPSEKPAHRPERMHKRSRHGPRGRRDGCRRGVRAGVRSQTIGILELLTAARTPPRRPEKADAASAGIRCAGAQVAEGRPGTLIRLTYNSYMYIYVLLSRV